MANSEKEILLKLKMYEMHFLFCSSVTEQDLLCSFAKTKYYKKSIQLSERAEERPWV